MGIRGSSALIAWLFCITGLFGQGTTSRVTGTVTDPTGSVIPGAAVTLVNEGTGQTFNTTTSEAGTYVFDAVQSGNYSVTVESQGFKKFASRGNVVTIGQPTTVNVSLEVGQVAESVEVTGSAELVQTSTSGNIGNVLSEKIIKDLPIVGTRGRNPLQLVLLQPGVVSGPSNGGETHVHGARDRAWNFTLDGIDNNDVSAGGALFGPTRTNPDSIAEFKVITSNPTAETGRNSGANVQLITKSGTNEFHGNGFWFYRTPRLNANEWVNNLDRLGKRMFVQNIYGGSIGGPIIKNKTFFFYNLQRLAASETRSVNRLVYTQQARQGIWRYVRGQQTGPVGTRFASVDGTGNVLPGLNIGSYNIAANDPQRLGLDPTVKALVEEAPLPNNFTGGDGLNTAYYSWAAPQFEKQQDQTFKIDHIFNAQNTVFFRAAWGYQNTECDAANSGLQLFPGQPCVVNTQRDPRNLAFNYRWNPTPRFTNEFVAGESRFTFNFLNVQEQRDGISFQSLDTINNRVNPANVPVVTRAYNFEAGNLRTLRTRQFVDNASYIAGAHAFKFGTNLRLVQHTDERGSIAGFNLVQSVNFDRAVNAVDPATFGLPADINVAVDRVELERSVNFLLGRVGRTDRGFSSNGQAYVAEPYRFQARYGELDFYGQDTWKVRRNLTLDVGLRWEIKRTPSEARDLIRRPDQLMTFGATPTNTVRWVEGELYKTDWKNFSPSIGFAWDPFSKGKTSIRSNYRIAYDRVNTFVLSSAVFQNLPGITRGESNQTYGQAGGRLSGLPKLSPPTVSPSALAQPSPNGDGQITVVDPDFETPTTHMWSFGIQHEVARNTVFSIDYIGRRAHNLLGAYNANQVDIQRNGFLNAFIAAQNGGESALLDQLTAPDTRRTAGESGAGFLRRQFGSELRLGAVGSVAEALARRAVGTRNLSDAAGLGPYFFMAFPQFGGGVRVIDSNDFSTYHGLEMQVERRFANGVAAQLSWTWSKSLDTRSFDPTFTVYGTGSAQSAASAPFDNGNRKLNYARSEFDRRHVIQSYFLYELPFGKGKRFGGNAGGVTERIIGGWQVSGFLRYQTGRPFTVFSGANTFSNVQQSTANCNGCSPSDGRVFTDNAQGLTFYFDDELRSRFSAPGAGQFGNTGRNFFQTAADWNMDASFSKRIVVTEGTNLEIRADVTNLTNTPTWDIPTAVINSSTFGRLRTPLDNDSRKFQLGLKFNF